MARFELGCASVVLFALASACATTGYSPYPLDLDHKLPPDAFARCRQVLLRYYDTIAYSNAENFRLETEWLPISDPPGERRATVYRDESRPASLAVVVELRRLTVPLIGIPHWTTSRGDAYSERQLAEWLRESLRDPETTGVAAEAGKVAVDGSKPK